MELFTGKFTACVAQGFICQRPQAAGTELLHRAERARPGHCGRRREIERRRSRSWTVMMVTVTVMTTVTVARRSESGPRSDWHGHESP